MAKQIDSVTKVQAWIVANETVAAEHHARLVEAVVHDHFVDFCGKINRAADRRPISEITRRGLP